MIADLIENFVKELRELPKRVNYKLKKLKVKDVKDILPLNRFNQIEFLKKVEKIRLTKNKEKIFKLIKSKDYPYPQLLSKKSNIHINRIYTMLKQLREAGLIKQKQDKSYYLTYQGSKYLNYKKQTIT